MNKLEHLFEKIVHRIDDEITNNFKIITDIRRKKIHNKEFTIISNNCWAGYVYRYYGVPYTSPTIGGYFFAEDYLRFLRNFNYYSGLNIKIIETNTSKWYTQLKEKGEENVIVGKLDDIEYIFLHYTDSFEAFKKWEKRRKRINTKNILFKFSEMNSCTEKMLIDFDRLDLKNKFCFVKKPHPELKSSIYYKGYEQEKEIKFDTYRWRKYININELINKI